MGRREQAQLLPTVYPGRSENDNEGKIWYYGSIMSFHKIIRRAEEPAMADNEFEQNNPDTETSTEGRSIGDVRDKSAPTEG